MCRMEIYNSDLTDGEKAKEDGELEHKYRAQQLQKENQRKLTIQLISRRKFVKKIKIFLK